jgi:hypothetical protein
MKKILMTAATLLIGLSLATPALAGHHGYFRGHGDGWRNDVVYYPARPRAVISLGIGFPSCRFAGPYRPAQVHYDPYPAYAPPPCCRSVWLPSHYVIEGGARFFVAGHWSHEGDD